MQSEWRLWKKVLAYVALAALAGISIWYVDRRASAPAPGEQKQRTADQHM